MNSGLQDPKLLPVEAAEAKRLHLGRLAVPLTPRRGNVIVSSPLIDGTGAGEPESFAALVHS